MNNTTLQVKFKQRLNKIDSQDYDNIQSWEIAEAFNKAQIEWCRRQLAGTNIRKEGDEMSKRRIDDLELLLKRENLTGVDINYNGTYGYFETNNFGQIYDPELGGDYLEFKKIECASQQCFPYKAAASTTETFTEQGDPTIVDPVIQEAYSVTEEIEISPGQWIPGTDYWNEVPVTVPIFSFQVHDVVPPNFLNTSYFTWTDAIPSNDSLSISGSTYVSQEPWLWNQNIEANNPFMVDNPGWSYGDAWNLANSPDIPNNNLILPFGGTQELAYAQDTSTFDQNCYNLVNTCGVVGSDIPTDVVTEMLSPNGYAVGGPNNEYMFYGEDGNVVVQQIPNLGVDGYNYNASPNTFVPNTPWWFSSFPLIMGLGGGLAYLTQCVTTGACWYIPSNVSEATFDMGGWQTTPDQWQDPVTEMQTTEYPEQVLEEGYTIPGEITEYGVTTDTPEQHCYCAPNADQENYCIRPRTMTVYLAEVANTDLILRDPLKNPSFEWCETFCTFQSSPSNLQGTAGIRVWRKDFFIMDPVLVYYRTPRRIEIAGSVDPYTGEPVVADINPEFKDDIVEILIDSAVSTLAGDISDANQMQRGEMQSEKNN